MKATIKTKRFAACPNGCELGRDGIGCVDHLIDRKGSAGPWYCEVCGHGWWLEFDGAGGLELSAWKEKLIRRIVMLELPPQTKPITILLKEQHIRFNADDEEDQDGLRYYYDEHTCPTNWMRVGAVVFDGREDPHGLFRFVRVIDDAEDRELHNGGAESLLASLSPVDAEAN